MVPSFREEFPEEKQLDPRYTFLHSTFARAFPDAPRSSGTISADGTFHVWMNLVVYLTIERKYVREIYTTVEYDVQYSNDDQSIDTRKYLMKSKSLQLTNFLVARGSGTEDKAETLLEVLPEEGEILKAVVNEQLDNYMKTNFTEQDTSWGAFKEH